jgi:ribosomal protein S18 acetylase RimI-like enzyme
MRVRPATAEDLELIAPQVANQSLLVRYGSTGEGFARGLRKAIERGDGLLVADDEVLLGMAWYQLDAGLGVGAYLKLIALVPGTEGRGIGGVLLDAVEAAAKAEKRRNLLLLVSDFNDRAQRFYERRGYVRSGKVEKAIRDNIDELLYVKRL